MKKKYEKPVILKLQSGKMNKFGSSPVYARKIRKEIDGVPIQDLVGEFGSPLFVYSERTLRERYRQLYGEFSQRYPNVAFGWSYKTNYLKAICATMHQEGALAEVVSSFEYEKAKRLGVAGRDIIFNGPHKSPAALARAVEEGALINIDSFDEIHDLEKIAEESGKKIKVGMRVNMDVGIHPQWSRFGLNLDSGEAMAAASRIASGGKLELNGLHCHIGTFILEPDAYGKQVEKLIRFRYGVRESFGFQIEYIDIGGGFPSRSKLKGTYLSPDVGIPPLANYVEKITNTLHKNLKPGDFPKLILECGRAIVDEAGYLIATVLSSKRLPDGIQSYVVDAGVNLLFTSYWYKFNIELEKDTHGLNEQSVIYGPLCMNIDVVDEGVLLPPLERGARLIFSPVGAYNNTQWMQFIECRPNVALIDEKGGVDLIREAENVEDVERNERLPERLRLKGLGKEKI